MIEITSEEDNSKMLPLSTHEVAIRGALYSVGTFFLRFATVPTSRLLRWVATCAACDGGATCGCVENLKVEFCRSDVLREGLAIASPSLNAEAAPWWNDDGQIGRRATYALARYYMRAACRPTPFGLFAAVTSGIVGRRTRITVPESIRADVRLSIAWLTDFANRAMDDPRVQSSVAWYSNPTSWISGGRWYFITREGRRPATFRRVAVRDNALLSSIRQVAAEGTNREELRRCVQAHGATREEADNIISSLIDRQALVAELALAISGRSRSQKITLDVLDRIVGKGHLFRDELHEAILTATALSRPYRINVSDTGDNSSSIGAEPVEHVRMWTTGRYHVDAISTPDSGRLIDSRIVEDIGATADALRRMFSHRYPPTLAEFRTKFRERFYNRRVGLLHALDPDRGLGFGEITRLEPDQVLGLQRGRETTAIHELRERERVLMRLITSRSRLVGEPLVLDELDIEQLSTRPSPSAPNAFASLVTFLTSPTNDYSTEVVGDYRYHATVPSAAWLTRFGHADPSIESWLVRYFAHEDYLEPNVIFAEVLHHYSSRSGDLGSRPLVRKYAIPCDGPLVDASYDVLPLHDLDVFLRGDEVVLWSRTHNRRVVPRVSTAVNYDQRSLDVVRFLVEVAYQDIPRTIFWSWGGLSDFRFLPRVRLGRAIVSPATWHVDSAEFPKRSEWETSAGRKMVDELKRRHGLPEICTLVEGDNRLPIVFENHLAVAAALESVTQRRKTLAITEWEFDGLRPLIGGGRKGDFSHEVLIPFLRNPDSVKPRRDRVVHSPVHIRRYLPGSEWFALKMYGSPRVVDELLLESIPSLVESARLDGGCTRWFFVRYADPGWHLRLRLAGEPTRLGEWWAKRGLELLLADAASTSLWKVQVEEYVPEVTRYGGPAAMPWNEGLFQRSSEAAIHLMSSARRQGLNKDSRWWDALRMLHVLSAIQAPSLDARIQIFAERSGRHRQRFTRGDESHLRSFKTELSRRYRAVRGAVEAIATDEPCDQCTPGQEDFWCEFKTAAAKEWATIHAHIAPLTNTPEGIMDSHIHMSINRLATHDSNKWEAVGYEYLARGHRTVWAKSGPRE